MKRAPVRPVLAAAVAFLGALLLTLLLQHWISNSIFLFFYAAVMVAAALGGMRVALVSIAAALLAVEFIIIDGVGVPAVTPELVVRDAIMAMVSLGVALLVQRLRSARAAADDRTAQTELLAESLREQAAELEVQVIDSEAMASELEDVNRALEVQSDAARRGTERAERLQRLMAMLLDTVGETGVSAVMVSAARQSVEADAAALAVVRPDASVDIVAMEGMPRAFDLAANGPTPLGDVVHTGEPLWIGDPEVLAHRYPDFARTLGCHAIAAMPLTVEEAHTGAVLFCFRQAGEFMPEDRSFMQLVAHEGAQALERVRLHQLSMRARIRAEFAERRLAFLAEASARLSASLDYRLTLASLAEMCAPELADWCIVHLIDEHGAPHLIAVTSVDPVHAEACRALEERYPGGCVLAKLDAVRASGRGAQTIVVDDRLIADVARDAGHRAALEALGFRTQLVTPIIVEAGVQGAITLVHGGSEREFGEGDVRLAVELGRRAGQAVENARLYQAAQFASDAKSDFLAVISHELRTPLNAIIGYTDLLLLGIPAEMPEQTLRQVQRIRSASDGLLNLVEEVLSFSRIEAGKEQLRISPVDVSALLRECVALVEPMAEQKSLTVTLHLPDEPVKIVSDERKIRQILTNLLSNAVKFTAEGSIAVAARADSREVRLTVEDTGIGIPEQHLERIFEPFWQVEQSATRRFGGTGLGLGVARKLARLLEGRLEVRSEVGKGSCFTLVLPQRMPGLNRT